MSSNLKNNIYSSLHILKNKNVFDIMNRIGTVTDYKSKMYKNEVCRKNKVGDGNNKTWQEEICFCQSLVKTLLE
jgi:hypothetical protein